MTLGFMAFWLILAVIISTVESGNSPFCAVLTSHDEATVWSPYINATFSAPVKNPIYSQLTQGASIKKDGPDATAFGRSIDFSAIAFTDANAITNVTLTEKLLSNVFSHGDLTGVKVALTHKAGVNEYYIEQRHLGNEYNCTMKFDGVPELQTVSVALVLIRVSENCTLASKADLQDAKWDPPKDVHFTEGGTINKGRIDEYLLSSGKSESPDKLIDYSSSYYQKQVLNNIQFKVQRKAVDPKQSASRTLVTLNYADATNGKVQFILQGGTYDQYKCHLAYSLKKGVLIEKLSFQNEIL